MDEMSALRLKCSETDGRVIKATLMSWTARSMNQVQASMHLWLGRSRVPTGKRANMTSFRPYRSTTGLQDKQASQRTSIEDYIAVHICVQALLNLVLVEFPPFKNG